MSAIPSASGIHRWRVFAAVWVALSILASAWAIASPISSGPDEPAHFVKAASVVRGQLVGPQGTYGNDVQVPSYVAWTNARTCFVFHPEVPADCATDIVGDPDEIVTGTTTAGYYNPLYYALVGWPSLVLHDESGLYAMRIVSGVLASGILALAFAMVATWRRRTVPLLGLLVALTPMALYVNGVVNPSSFEIAGTLAAFVTMLTIVTQPNERLLRERAIVLVISSVLAVSTRTISPLWIGIALLAPLLLLGWREIKALLRRRVVLISGGMIVLGAAMSLAWTPLSTRLAAGAASSSAATPVITTVFPDVGQSPFFGFVKMITLTFTNASDMIGNFGWMDTPLPATSIVIWTILIGILLVAAFSLLRGRRAVLGVLLLALALLLPAVIQAAFITSGGYIWQGRYGLPILVMLIFGLAALVSETLDTRALSTSVLTRLAFAVLLGWMAGQGYGFLKALRRNVIGSSTSWKELITAPEWIPPGGVVPVLIAFMLGAVILAAIVLRLRALDRASDTTLREVSSVPLSTRTR